MTAIEAEEIEAPDVEARPDPTHVRIADADRPEPAPVMVAAKERCKEGLVPDDDGVCSKCIDDAQCRGACTLDTGRCTAEGWCSDARDCVKGETCDGGMCVHVDREEGPCGIGAIYFAWDSDTVSPGSKARLAAAADCLAGLTDFYVEGHDDEFAVEEFSIMLSERRARAVRDLLVAHRVPETKMQVIAKGSLEAQGTNARTRSRDRKVVLVAPDPIVP